MKTVKSQKELQQPIRIRCEAFVRVCLENQGLQRSWVRCLSELRPRGRLEALFGGSECKKGRADQSQLFLKLKERVCCCKGVAFQLSYWPDRVLQGLSLALWAWGDQTQKRRTPNWTSSPEFTVVTRGGGILCPWHEDLEIRRQCKLKPPVGSISWSGLILGFDTGGGEGFRCSLWYPRPYLRNLYRASPWDI